MSQTQVQWPPSFVDAREAPAGHTAFIGLGANLGDRVGNIRAGLRYLVDTGAARVTAVSHLYETPPWGFADQPAFINAAARIVTTLGQRQLLIALKAAERTVGRQPTFRNGPRAIDMDLLVYGEERMDRRGLIVPHPGMWSRAFVLIPLRDLLPNAIGPDGRTISEYLDGMDLSGIRPI